jgi:alkaline phosphatase D
VQPDAGPVTIGDAERYLAAMVSEVFAHGVASGDPLTDRVVIWTRITTEGPPVEVHWVVARDEAITDVVATGATTATPEHDAP